MSFGGGGGGGYRHHLPLNIRNELLEHGLVKQQLLGYMWFTGYFQKSFIKEEYTHV